MEADIHNPPQGYRYCVDGVHKVNIIEWNKKRKFQSNQLDLLRPKHKCWIEKSSSEHASTFDDENPALESMHIYVLKGRTDAENSEADSVKDSNCLSEDSITAMSVNEEGKHVAESSMTYQHGRPSTLLGWDDYSAKDNHHTLDDSAVDKGCTGEADTFHDKECDPSYHSADLQALKNLEEKILEIESCRDNLLQEYAKDSTEESTDMEFEDLFTKRENHHKYVLSSGRWDLNQEAQSGTTRAPTIDQEFEQYFSMLML
ncbi:Protein FAR-RED-ELONGATED HYPOCOTYL [Vigna angularis]|uniref:Protein FAR-RED-ELONGATED HYPOCOTYL n=2 Tax=Phaseolus angularis TaxID=3914 RepID=A0A8T0JS08_PHAAN|nr:protein FAR-RED ELONGATED HYPOCOTYL 1 [Vigna angularis]KAG2380894.1 Protein FAR-RED-ELONGATED HYPOCOTYL [Vigna angularis]